MFDEELFFMAQYAEYEEREDAEEKENEEDEESSIDFYKKIWYNIFII